MSYVVQSSENTVKVILNSQLATHGTASRPQFTMKTPITTPYDQTGLVNLENLVFRSPSMFTKRILNSMQNTIHVSASILEGEDVYLDETDFDPWTSTADNDPTTEPDTIGQDDGGGYYAQNYGVEGDDTGTTETKENNVTYAATKMILHADAEAPPQEQSSFKFANEVATAIQEQKNLYHHGQKAAFSKVDADLFLDDKDNATCPNYYSMRTMLIACLGVDMITPYNVAELLFGIVNDFRIFDIVLPPLNHDITLTGTGTKYQQVTLTYNTAASRVEMKINGDTEVTTSSEIISKLITMMSYTTHYVFNLAVPDTNNNVYVLKGPWLKVLGIEADEGNYHVIDKTRQLKCTLQVGGYDYIHMHTNFSRVVYAANQQSEDWQIVPTNIFWTINVPSEPGRYSMYTNQSSSGKIPFNMPIMDEIEIYFTDKYGDIIDDLREFSCTLTFDFSDKQLAKEPMTIKRARRTLAMI